MGTVSNRPASFTASGCRLFPFSHASRMPGHADNILDDSKKAVSVFAPSLMPRQGWGDEWMVIQAHASRSTATTEHLTLIHFFNRKTQE